MRSLLLAVASAPVLIACAGTDTPSGVVIACPQVIIATNLVYPAPGATGVPVNVGSIVIGGPATRVTLAPPSGTPIVSTAPTAVPSPIPPPNAPPLNAATAFAVPALAPATTYGVVSQDTMADAQCPQGQPRALGSFTTR